MPGAGYDVFISYKSEDLALAIDQFIKAHNIKAAPFEWKKAVVHPSPSPTITRTYASEY